jgi:TRAP-type transport system periplasmic protein
MRLRTHRGRPGARASVAALSALLVVITGCGADDNGDAPEGADNGGETEASGDFDELEFNIAIGDPADSSVGVTAQHFADELESRSGGTVAARVHADGVLFGGDQNAAVNQLQNGSLDAVILSTSVYASFEGKMNVLSLPYLFGDTDEFITALEGDPGQQLLDSLERLDTQGLSLMIRTPRHITNSVRPIEEPDDLQGVSLRVPNNELWVNFFGSLGANPTPMDFTEVYSALQLGTIDGQENPTEVPLTNNFFEVQDYMSLTGHIADGYILAMNAELFESVGEETQQLLLDVAAETAQFKADYDVNEEESMLAELEEHGMQINELSDEQRAAFQERAQELYPDFADLVGGEDFLNETLEFLGREPV